MAAAQANLSNPLIPNKQRGRSVPILILALFAIAVTAWQFGSPKRAWYSSPDAKRHIYYNSFSAATMPSTRPSRPLTAADVRTERTRDELYWVWEESEKDLERELALMPPAIASANTEQVVTFPNGGTCRVLFACMGYDPAFKKEDAWDVEGFEPTSVLVRGSDWKPMTQEEFHELQRDTFGEVKWQDWEVSNWDPGSMGLTLMLYFQNVPDFDGFAEVECWNWNTASDISDASGWMQWPSPGPGEALTMHNYKILPLHPVEVGFGFDLAYGPVETAKVPVQVGSQIHFSNLEGEVVALDWIPSSGAQSVSLLRGKPPEVYAYRHYLRDSAEPRTHVGISLSPAPFSSYCVFDFANRNGDYSDRQKMTSRHTRIVGASSQWPADQLDHLRVRYYPNQVRAIFHLPPLLGVPKGNEAITNLFDMVVPHAEFKDAHEMENFICDRADVSLHLAPDTEFPEGYFPKRIENQTLGEILDEYLAHSPKGRRMVLDPDTHYFRVRPPFTLKGWFQNRVEELQKRFPWMKP